jgi:hypothetical protein
MLLKARPIPQIRGPEIKFRKRAIVMNNKMTRTAIVSMAALATILVAAAQQPNAGQSMGQQPSTTTPKAQPNLMPQEKAMHPAPSSSAQPKTQKTSVGKGALTVKTAQPVDFWQEQVAFGGRKYGDH